MKILHLLDHSLPIHSGYSFRTAEILHEQRRRGWNAIALTGPKHELNWGNQEDNYAAEYERTRIRPVHRRLPGPIDQLFVIQLLANKSAEICQRERVDVLHAHSPSLNGIAAIRVGRRFSIPVVYEMRASWEDAAVDHGTSRPGGLRYQLTRWSESWVLKRAQHVMTICDGLKDEISSRGIASSRVTVVPNAVDSERFTKPTACSATMRQKYEAVNRKLLVFCGSFYAYEGLDKLIQVIPAVREKHPTVLTILAGGGEQESALRDQVDSLGLSDHVRFPGRVSQDEVKALYSMADACVFPRESNRLTEMVTPLKPLEAMALEGVVIASDVGGHKELIRHGCNGFLYESRNDGGLLACIFDVLDSPDLAQVRDNARKFVVNDRSWRASVENYAAIYERLIS